ncbi:hypothetical protein ACX40Y_14345 [Sphingomonas sp. RS6]
MIPLLLTLAAPLAAPPAAALLPPSAPAQLALTPDSKRVAAWVSATGDNRGLPYLIVDKKNAAMFMFDAHGKAITAQAVLIGIAAGDEATPGIGAKSLSAIGPAEKTTPAGRFLARFGLAVGKARVLWVDYHTSVALHPIPPHYPKKERRRERLLSATSKDNRITFGCINVPRAFYAKTLAPMFRRKGGYVYVLPDSKAIEDVFPGLRAMPVEA